MNTDHEHRIDALLGRMRLEQKVGQLFVFSLIGTQSAPDTYERVARMNCSGLRVCQNGRMFRRYRRPTDGDLQGNYRVPRGLDRDFCSNRAPYVSAPEFARHINSVKRMGLERESGIPLHFVLDQEGGYSADFNRGGVSFFPLPMGLAASGDPEVCYRASRAVARQVRAAGMNMIHSPVLDVNTEPRNPEIGIRSFSNDPQVCVRYATQMLKAFDEQRLIATAKHFPGRGASHEDAHFDLPVINVPKDEFYRVHLEPYKELIAAGLPAVMIAHTAYPMLDPSGKIATVSKPIVTGILREEFGFDGVITTDSISMGALVKQCGDIPEACVQSVEAGADLVLLKDDDWIVKQTYDAMLAAVQSGRITEDRVHESLRRTLRMKFQMGLFDEPQGDLANPNEVEATLNSREVCVAEDEAAACAMTLLRDEAGLLPLPRDKDILLVEQAAPLGETVNDGQCHCGMLWENMLKFSDCVFMVETPIKPEPNDEQRVLDRIDEADLLVMTNDFCRGHGIGRHTEFIREIIARGKKVVVVTNTPYAITAPKDFPAVLCTFGSTPAAWRYAAKVLFGEARAEGQLPIEIRQRPDSTEEQ